MSKYVRANWVCWRPTDRYPEVREDNGRRIAVVVAQGYLTSDRSEEAIARLIASAPELLNALERLFDEYEDRRAQFCEDPLWKKWERVEVFEEAGRLLDELKGDKA